MNRILIQGGSVVILDPTLNELEGDVLVEGDKIVAVAPSEPKETQAFLASEIERWKKVIAEAGIKPQQN